MLWIFIENCEFDTLVAVLECCSSFGFFSAFLKQVHDKASIHAGQPTLESTDDIEVMLRYYEGGVSSVYFWDLDDGFAGVVLLKKSTYYAAWC